MQAINEIIKYKDSEDFLKHWYRKREHLTGADLKYIAIFAMLLSHISQTGYLYMFGENFYQMAASFTIIGRLAMPIFCFFTVQAIIFSKDIKKYFLRMLTFAIISEIPFDLAFSRNAFDWTHQNVIFTLLIAGLTIFAMDNIWKGKSHYIIKVIAMLAIGFLGSYIAEFMKTDYGAKGVFAIILLYLTKNNKILTLLALLWAFRFEFYMPGAFPAMTYGFVYLSIPLILLYNGQRGRQNKWLFYIFYPGHLLIIYFLISLRMNVSF